MTVRKYWRPLPETEQYVAALVPDNARLVVDVGANPSHRFARAHKMVGWEGDVRCDLELAALPFGLQEVDFLYCRHTLEDLANPEPLLREIARVARGGYLETPSPLAELSRGVDAGWAAHRGYIHHRWLLWSDGGVLHVLPKYPIVERLASPPCDCLPLDGGRDNRWLWNTAHAWTGRLDYRVYKHEVDFDLSLQSERCAPLEYLALLQRACEEARASCRNWQLSIEQTQPQESLL
jgi:SAM-dependent methyltransferase